MFANKKLSTRQRWMEYCTKGGYIQDSVQEKIAEKDLFKLLCKDADDNLQRAAYGAMFAELKESGAT